MFIVCYTAVFSVVTQRFSYLHVEVIDGAHNVSYGRSNDFMLGLLDREAKL